MTQNNNSLTNQSDYDNLNSSIGNSKESQISDELTEQQKSVNATPEEIEQANKPQPNVILSKAGGPNIELNRDMERVNPRANEAPDSTDTNTGGIVAGAAKGASQS